MRACLSCAHARASRSNARGSHSAPLVATPPPSTLLRPHYDYRTLIARAPYLSANARRRGSPATAEPLAPAYEALAAAQARGDALRASRKALARGGGAPTPEAAAAGRALKAELAEVDAAAARARSALEAAALALPCDTHPSSPIGPESAAVRLATLGTPRAFDFAPRDHVALGARLRLFDVDAPASIAGCGFAMLTGDGVDLELGLITWALAHLRAEGFSLLSPPDIARGALVEGCGFAPRGGDAAGQVYRLSGGGGSRGGSGVTPPPPPTTTATTTTNTGQEDDLCLVGTSEIACAGLHAGELLPAAAIASPLLYAAWGHCFRRESGGGGAATRGIYRVHQFTKVEMFALVSPCTPLPPGVSDRAAFHIPAIADALLTTVNDEDGSTTEGGVPPNPTSEAVFARLVDVQAHLLSTLGLHARVLDMPTMELGASAYRKVDIEAWMPGRIVPGGSGAEGAPIGAWGEVSSASNCVDYQSRRLSIRCRVPEGGGGGGGAASLGGPTAFVHTLNATAAAIPRLIVALLETHQDSNGDVALPPCLTPYMGGRTLLRPPRAASFAWGMGRIHTTQ